MKEFILKNFDDVKKGEDIYRDNDIRITVTNIEKSNYSTTFEIEVQGFASTSTRSEKGDIILASNYNFGKGALSKYYGNVAIDKDDSFIYEKYQFETSSLVGSNKVFPQYPSICIYDMKEKILKITNNNPDIYLSKDFINNPVVIYSVLMKHQNYFGMLVDYLNFFKKEKIIETFTKYPDITNIILKNIEKELNGFERNLDYNMNEFNNFKNIAEKISDDEVIISKEWIDVEKNSLWRLIGETEDIKEIINVLEEAGISLENQKEKLNNIVEGFKKIANEYDNYKCLKLYLNSQTAYILGKKSNFEQENKILEVKKDSWLSFAKDYKFITELKEELNHRYNYKVKMKK